MTDNDPLEDDGVQVKLSGRKDSTSSKISNRRDDECCLVKRPVKICLRVCLILFILAVLFFIGVLIWYVLCPILDIGCSGSINSTDAIDAQPWKNATSVHQFKALDINDDIVDLSVYKGSVLVIMNVASEWGLAKTNYLELEALYGNYSNLSPGLRVLAFPCNQFSNQEPGTNAEIKAHVTSTYGVTFDLFSKIRVNGGRAHPLWNFLTKQNGGVILWNFTKFLIDKDGVVIERFEPREAPSTMEDAIKKLLGITKWRLDGGRRLPFG